MEAGSVCALHQLVQSRMSTTKIDSACGWTAMKLALNNPKVYSRVVLPGVMALLLAIRMLYSNRDPLDNKDST